MQKDFHYGVTYVVARLAGFEHKEAEIIAYCSQYVDDAVNSGVIEFDNGAMYDHISSAHKMLDYRNFEELANQRVWMPFHFLPGNGGAKAGANPAGTFIEKIKCKPNSFVALDMIRECIEDKNKLYGLHRLGITAHVYADTWAHQGFSGVKHETNNVDALDDQDKVDKQFVSRLKNYFEDLFDETKCHFVADVLPLGHGAALSNPDLPYLKWNYKDNTGKIIRRDNPAEFTEAADEMCKVMRRFISGDPDASVNGLSTENKDKIINLFRTIVDKDEEERHNKWLKKIKSGYFDFPKVDLNYIPKGKGSWKYMALATESETDEPFCKFKYDPSFLQSNWKLLHDALQAHRFSVVHNILPRYGICTA